MPAFLNKQRILLKMNNFIIKSILKRHEEKNNYMFAESMKRDASLKNRMSKESSRGNYLTRKKMVSVIYSSLDDIT